MTDATKHWSDMATEMVNTWTETGNQMWKSWFDLMSTVPGANPISQAQPELKEATQRFLDNRELVVRFLKISVDAWRDIFPKIQAGGKDWQEVLKNYTEQMKEQFAVFTSGAKLVQNTTDLWNIYLEETRKFSQLWLNPSLFSGDMMTKALTGNTSAIVELNNLYWKLLYEDSVGNLMQAPSLGLPREFNRKLLNGFEAWRVLYQATANYEVVLANIQVKSFEALMKELVSLAEKGKQIKDWKEFQQVWSETADQVFSDAFCEEENLKIRGKFLNSLNAYRVQQQELMEISLKMMNLPSRSEVDEIHKTIYELRKEVKSLKKALAKYESAAEVNTSCYPPEE